MFEKEAEERLPQAKIDYCNSFQCKPEEVPAIEIVRFGSGYKKGFKDGAEFGYNKANEWHYVKDKLPKEMQEVIICIKDEKRITRAKRIKNDLWTSPSEDFNTQEIIAWKDFPELPKKRE